MRALTASRRATPRETGPTPFAELSGDGHTHIADQRGEPLSGAESLLESGKDAGEGSPIRRDERRVERATLKHQCIERSAEDDGTSEVALQQRAVHGSTRQFESNRLHATGCPSRRECVQCGRGRIDEQPRHLARRLQPTVAHDRVVACYFQLHNFRASQTLVARECGECAAEVRRVQGDY